MLASKSGYDSVTVTFTPLVAEDTIVDVAMFYRIPDTTIVTTITTLETTRPLVTTETHTPPPTPKDTDTPLPRNTTTERTTLPHTPDPTTPEPNETATTQPTVSIFGYVISSVTGNGVARVSVTCTNLGAGGGGGTYGPTGTNGYWIIGNCVRGDTYHCVGEKSGGVVTSKDILAV
jgi:hypothetical protein